MKVLIGTNNTGKLQGAKEALSYYFEDFSIEKINVESEVGEQPVNEQILQGTKNRINNLKIYAKENNLDVDFYLAIESGISNQLGEWINLSIAGIEDKNGQTSFGTSAGFPIPERYIEEIMQTDMSKVFNKLFTYDEERHNQAGTVKIFTKGVISRIELTKSAFVMAITTFINGEKWR